MGLHNRKILGHKAWHIAAILLYWIVATVSGLANRGGSEGGLAGVIGYSLGALVGAILLYLAILWLARRLRSDDEQAAEPA